MKIDTPDLQHNSIINSGSATLNAISAASAPINSIYLDSSTLKLMVKDGYGVSHELGATGLKIATGTYTGNGVYGRAVNGVGFQPRWLQVYPMSHNVGRDIIKSELDGGGYSMRIGQGYETGHVIALTADGFTVGTTNDVNANGILYSWVAFTY